MQSSWKSVTLEEIGTFSKGAGISKSELLDDGVAAIRYGELYTKHHIKISKIGSRISPDSAANAARISYGDILFAGSGETIEDIGKSAVYLSEEECYAGGDIIIFSPSTKLDPLFLAYLLNSPTVRKYLRELGQGQSVVHLYKRDLEKIMLAIPDRQEQGQIVLTLETWSRYLDELDEKIKLKKSLKNGLVQQLLSGNKRLRGFNDDWQTVKLGDIGKVSMCKRIFKEQTTETGTIPFYKIGTFGKIADAHISEEIYNDYREKYSFPKPGDILISASGTIGRLVVYNGKPAYFQDSNIIWIENDEKLVLNAFLYHAYNTVTWHTAHGTIARLYNDNVRRIIIKAPRLEEQRAISDILTTLDQDIESLHNKRELVAAQRGYLISRFVTGKIRLPVPQSNASKETTHA